MSSTSMLTVICLMGVSALASAVEPGRIADGPEGDVLQVSARQGMYRVLAWETDAQLSLIPGKKMTLALQGLPRFIFGGPGIPIWLFVAPLRTDWFAPEEGEVIRLRLECSRPAWHFDYFVPPCG